MRTRFILGLILLGVALHFIAKTLNGVLPLMQEAAQYPVSRQTLKLTQKQLPASTGFTLPRHFALPAKKLKKELSPKLINPADALKTPGHSFLQITMEDFRPRVNNKALGTEASARLEVFLAHKREQNAQLASETEALFGKEAQQEIITVLVNDERESLANAKESQSPADYAARQQKADKKTSTALNAIFEKYKKQFNYRLHEKSPAWKDFFKRVNNFKKAAD